MLLRELYAVAVKCRRCALVCRNRRFYNRNFRSRPKVESNLKQGPGPALDFLNSPAFEIAEIPVQFEMAGRQQRPFFPVGTIAEFRVLSGKSQVADGVFSRAVPHLSRFSRRRGASDRAPWRRSCPQRSPA